MSAAESVKVLQHSIVSDWKREACYSAAKVSDWTCVVCKSFSARLHHHEDFGVHCPVSQVRPVTGAFQRRGVTGSWPAVVGQPGTKQTKYGSPAANSNTVFAPPSPKSEKIKRRRLKS